MARLLEACLAPDLTGFHTVWGLSDNTRSWWSPEGGRSIGFEPRYDAEQYASQFPDPKGPT